MQYATEATIWAEFLLFLGVHNKAIQSQIWDNLSTKTFVYILGKKYRWHLYQMPKPQPQTVSHPASKEAHFWLQLFRTLSLANVYWSESKCRSTGKLTSWFFLAQLSPWLISREFQSLQLAQTPRVTPFERSLGHFFHILAFTDAINHCLTASLGRFFAVFRN